MAERALPAVPLGPDGPYLAAILGVLDDIHRMLAARFGTDPAEVREPAAVPVKEPAPVGPPRRDTEPVEEPAPAPARGPDPPPRTGRGSGLQAWADFAAELGVTYPTSASRDDIIAACQAANVIDSR